MPARDKWRKIADQLAERLSHYEDCPQQGRHPSGWQCPFCEDARIYAAYVAAGGRDYRGTFLPAGRSITPAELAASAREVKIEELPRDQ